MKRLLKLHAYWQILAAQVFLIFLAVFMEEYFLFYVLFAIGMVDIFGWVIASVIEQRWLKALAIALGLGAIACGALAFFPDPAHERFIYLLITCAAFAFAAFALISIFAMAKGVFMTDEVTADIVVGSICIYVMIALFFAFLFAGISVVDPNSFNMGGVTFGSLESITDYFYFSFVTLTTLGYGDMVPTSNLSKMLSSLEAMTGPIYLAILVARLVGQYMIRSGARKKG